MLNTYNFLRCARLALLSIPLLGSLAIGQITNNNDDTSTPIPGAGHDYLHLLSETVNPANGSVSIRINVPTPKGRGLSLPFSFAYDSNGVNHLVGTALGNGNWASDFSPLSSGGWTYGVPLLTWNSSPYSAYSTTTGTITCDYATGYMFQDPGGGRHELGITTMAYNYGYPCQTTVNSGGDDYYRATVTSNSILVADADGTVYNFPLPMFIAPPSYPPWTFVEPPASITDRNNNTITTSSSLNALPPGGGPFTFTEAASGRNLISSSGFGVTGNTVSVPGYGNSPLTYTLTWASVGAGFTVSGQQELNDPNESDPSNPSYCTGFGSASNYYPVVTAITLPNGQQYQFQYDTTDGVSTTTYGLVSKIIYPTGGYVSYVWGENKLSNFILGSDSNGNPNTCSYIYGVPAVTDRYVSYDGQTVALHQQFSYSTTWNNTAETYQGQTYNTTNLWNTKTSKLISNDRLGNTATETDYTYSPVWNAFQPVAPGQSSGTLSQVPVESTTTVLNAVGGTPLRTVNKTWWDQFEMQAEQVVDNGTVTSDQYFVYGMGAEVTDKYECGAGQACYCPSGQNCSNALLNSPPPAFTRLTQTAYHNFGSTSNYPYGPSIFDRPDSVTVTGVISPGNTGTATQTTYTYDGNGNATSKTEKCLYNCTADIVTGYQYNSDGQLNSMTDPRQNTTTYGYSCSDTYLSQINYPTTSSNGQTHHVSFQYDCPSGLLTQSTDQNGQHTLYNYNDALNRLTQATYPDGGQTTNIYTDYTGGTPAVSSIETDKLIDSSHVFKSYQFFDGLGLVTQTQTADQQGQGNICVDTTYDGFERVLTVSNPHYNCSTASNLLTTYAYDPVGRTTSVLYPDQTSGNTSYNGLSSTVSDAAGKTRTLVNDELGHLTSVTEDPNRLGYVTDYPYYSALDDLLTVSQSGQTRSFTYDSFSRLVTAANPENGTITYAYDGNGNMISKADARGTTCYGHLNGSVCDGEGYDELNRVLYKTYSDTSTVRACYAYDNIGWTGWNDMTSTGNAVGHLTASWSVQHGGTVVAANESYQFDPMGRVQEQRQCTPATCGLTNGLTNYPLSAGYNLMGNEINLWDSSVVRYTQYDSTDRLLNFTASFNVSPPALTATGPGNQILLTSPVYGPLGLTQASLGNGLTETRAYNNRTWLGYLTVQNGSNPIYSLNGNCTLNGNPALCYAGNGNVLSANDSENGNWSYSLYDGVNRLNTATNSTTGQTFSYNFDAWGNMTCSYSQGPGTCLALTYDTVNMTNRILDGIHQYDNNVPGGPGNMTADGTHGYVYDLENRIACVGVDINGNCTTNSTYYFYDPQGQRVGKQQYDTLEDYVYEPQGNIISVHNGSANLLRSELYSPDGRHVATWTPNPNGQYWDPYPPGLFWNHADWLGTERVRTDINGNLAETCTDTPYGMNLNCVDITVPADTGPMHFTGKQRDAETGLDYFGARYNASNLGRFMTPDEVLADQHPSSPQSWNLYSYTRNNPLRFVDDDGQKVIEAALKYASYDVHGATAAEARANALAVSGFRSSEGEPMMGGTSGPMTLTNMQFQWAAPQGYEGISVTERETLTSADVDLKQTIKLPSWAEESQASTEDQTAWDNAMTTLKNHELEHATINREQAHKLDASLPGTSGSGIAPTSVEAVKKANAQLTQKIRQKVKTNAAETATRQQQLDQSTDHGRKKPDQ